MTRVLISVLAVVAAVLALVLGEPMLYAVAVVLLVVVLVLAAVVARRRNRDVQPAYVPPPSASRDELKELGIVDIRPRERRKDAESPVGAELASKTAVENGHRDTGTAGEQHKSVGDISSSTREEGARPKSEPSRSAEAASDGGVSGAVAESPCRAAVTVPLLQSLRAALGAQTVCLLRHEGDAGNYEVCAVAGGTDARQPGTLFSIEAIVPDTDLLQQAVTVRDVGDGGVPSSGLKYRGNVASARQVAVAPVQQPDSGDLLLLLADTDEHDNLGRPHARTLLVQYARLLGTLFDTPERFEEQEQAMRSRREIIEEEMERARAEDRLLALALVYLNRAEAIAEEGDEAVAAAEHALETRLRQVAHDGRIELFGELTYGVFFSGNVPEIEAWGARIQQAFANETGWLEGGVSIGIALLRKRHQDPDEFRADAMDALREAYESGTCTILE